MLAVLAAAGARSVSRDRLLGILWPDTDEERARHALSQTLYSLRRVLGREPVTGGADLRLDPGVSSDIGDALAALESGDQARAVGLYLGPFLDGFYLEGASEFSRWVEEERARLARLVVHAAEALAAEATAAGDAARTAAAWRKLTTLDPLSARFATSYMRALAALGDRAGALAHAREHESAVRRELEASADHEVVDLAARLRRERALAPPMETTDRSPLPGPTASAKASGEAAAPQSPALVPHRARPRPLTWLLGAALLVVVASAGRAVLRSRAGAPVPVLAVGGISDRAARDTAGFTGVLTDMLATDLGQVRGLSVVANSRIFELMRPGADSLRGAASDAARRAGATQVLEGEVSYAPEGGLQLELRRIDLKSGMVRQGYRVRALDRYGLIDSATSAVARDFALPAPGGAIAEVSTASPIAYRLYEQGLRALYQYDAAAAYRLMQSALEEDSTFAMAAYYAWEASGRTIETGSRGRRYLDLATRLASRAPDRERLLILGTTLMTKEDPAAVFYAESLAIRFPRDRNSQFLLGEIEASRGSFPAAVRAYDRAIALDSAAGLRGGESCRACESLQGLAAVYLAMDSAPSAERSMHRWLAMQPGNGAPWMVLGEILQRLGRWNEEDRAFRVADSIAPGRYDYRVVQLFSLIRRGDYPAVSRDVVPLLRDPRADLRAYGLWILTIALRNEGRLREATTLLDQLVLPDGTRLPPGTAAADPTELATVDFDAGRFLRAADRYAALAAENLTNPYPGHRARGRAWTLTHEAAARAAAGDTLAVRRLADSVEAIGALSLFGRSPRLHFFIRGLLLSRAGRHADAVEYYRRAIVSWSEGYTRINFELARSLLALGRAREAVSALSPALRGAIESSNLYITRTELHELLAQAFAAAGERDSAAAHFREVARAWEHADPPFQARRRAALDWLARPGAPRTAGGARRDR